MIITMARHEFETLVWLALKVKTEGKSASQLQAQLRTLGDAIKTAPILIEEPTQ